MRNYTRSNYTSINKFQTKKTRVGAVRNGGQTNSQQLPENSTKHSGFQANLQSPCGHYSEGGE